MCCCRKNKNNHLPALLKKNWILTKRNRCSTICEMFLPILFIFLLGTLRNQIDIDDLPEKSFINEPNTINPDFSDSQSQSLFSHCGDLEKNGGQVAIYPENSMTQQLASELMKNQYISKQGIVFMKTATDLDDLIKGKSYSDQVSQKVCFGIEFNILSNGVYDYNLRFNNTRLPTQLGYNQENKYVKQQLDFYNDYIEYGFVHVMNLISNIILKNETPTGTQPISIKPQILPMKQEEQKSDDFYNIVGRNTNFYIVLPLIINFLKMTNGILTEKEKKIREGMKMMGMDNSQFYQSWIITYSIKNLFTSLGVACALKALILKNASVFFLFSWHNMFGTLLIFQSLFISTFFSRARIGLLAAMVFFLGQIIVFWTIDIQAASGSSLTLMAAIPHAAMSLSTSHFIYFETNGQDVNFSILSESLNGYKELTTFVSLQINMIVFSLLFAYLDQVFPNEFGIRKHPLFFLGMKYGEKKVNKIKKKLDSKNVELIQDLYSNSDQEDEECNDGALQEEVEGVLQAQVKNNQALVIKNLRKEFYSDGKKKIAVDGLSLEMYNSQVFSFLGHNGAGKTTTISMINGLLEPSSGSIKIKGFDVATEMDEVRKTLGVCPQHDVLFDELTVKEHLYLFATLKNMPKEEQEEAITKIIADVDLVEKTDYLSKNLSGGQKRKLSVAIAFIGGSDVILLDEPTSGMDVEARRHIWDMLKNYKQDKIVILTTHFMDEADYLGDRIGIISDGKLKCVGSSIFLKESYGNGFNFTFVKTENTSPSKPLIKFVKKNLKDCELISDVSAEVAFQVPKKNISKFQDFFQQLEQQKESLYVRSYGISVTTLEQVFLKVASENHNHVKQVEKSSEKTKDIDNFDLNKVRVQGSTSIFMQHFSALVMKRFHCFKRDIGGLFCEVIIPMLMITLGLFASSVVSVDGIPAKLLTPDSLSSPKYMYGSSATTQQDYFLSLPLLTETKMTPIKSTANLISQFDAQMLISRDIDLKFGVYTQNDSFDTVNNVYSYYSFINTQTENAICISLNILNNLIINQQTNKSIQIIPRNKPLPLTDKEKNANSAVNGITVAMIFSIGLAFIPASLIVFIVKERVTQVKHQQVVSGISRFAYWSSNLFMDLVKYLIPAILCPWLAFAFNVTSITDSEVFYIFYAIFILYGPALILFTYVFSFMIKNYGNGQLFTFFMHMIFGCLISVTIMVLRIIYKMDNNGIEFLAWCLRFMPSFCFSFSILNLTSRALYAVNSHDGKLLKPLDLKIAGGDILALCLQIVVYGLLLIIIEKMGQRKMFSKESSVPYQPKSLDSDVQDEVERVEDSDPQDYVVHVKGLRKVFVESSSSHKVAVDNLNFAIENGEVFCLLGVNGAGKTTTMRMLTGDEPIVNGDAYIQGYKIPEEIVNAQQYIGYCPQFDALLDQLTAREHLELYAAIKGIPKDMIAPLVDKKLDEMNLRQFEHICAGTYSGGNKRKLSVAIAMLGNPPIVFLDEPSTGMDPGNRRFMWDVISRISTQRKQSSIILTTHSMEEAEALSTRVGIMVAGNFQCMGSVQHLKSKFGEGYEIDIKTTLPTTKAINKFSKSTNMKQLIKKAQLKDFLISINMQHMLYQITQNGFCSQLFYEMKKKEEKGEGVEAKLIVEFSLMYSKTLKVQDYIHKNFGEFTIIEQFNNFTRYRIHSEKSIGEIFSMFNSAQEELEINHYTVNQPTLEQIFNQIAKKAMGSHSQENKQNDLDEVKPEKSKKDKNKKKKASSSDNDEEIELSDLVKKKEDPKKKKKNKKVSEDSDQESDEENVKQKKKAKGKDKKSKKQENNYDDDDSDHYQEQFIQNLTSFEGKKSNPVDNSDDESPVQKKKTSKKNQKQQADNSYQSNNQSNSNGFIKQVTSINGNTTQMQDDSQHETDNHNDYGYNDNGYTANGYQQNNYNNYQNGNGPVQYETNSGYYQNNGEQQQDQDYYSNNKPYTQSQNQDNYYQNGYQQQQQANYANDEHDYENNYQPPKDKKKKSNKKNQKNNNDD